MLASPMISAYSKLYEDAFKVFEPSTLLWQPDHWAKFILVVNEPVSTAAAPVKELKSWHLPFPRRQTLPLLQPDPRGSSSEAQDTVQHQP